MQRIYFMIDTQKYSAKYRTSKLVCNNDIEIKIL